MQTGAILPPNAPCHSSACDTSTVWTSGAQHALQLRELCRRTSQLLQEQPLRMVLNASKTLLRKKQLKWLRQPACLRAGTESFLAI